MQDPLALLRIQFLIFAHLCMKCIATYISTMECGVVSHAYQRRNSTCLFHDQMEEPRRLITAIQLQFLTLNHIGYFDDQILFDSLSALPSDSERPYICFLAYQGGCNIQGPGPIITWTFSH